MALTSKANELRNMGEDIIVLTVGEPDFDTPGYIKKCKRGYRQRHDKIYSSRWNIRFKKSNSE